MTDHQLLEIDFQAVGNARSALQGWSDVRVRRIERYLCRIGNLVQSRKWGMIVEERLGGTEARPALHLSKLKRNELIAVNILRLVAKRVLDMGDEAEKLLYKDECMRLVEIQSRAGGEHDTREQLSSKVKQAEKHSKAQSDKAKKNRIKIGDQETTISDIIESLVKENPEETANNLWTHFVSKLSEIGCNPTETNARNLLTRTVKYDYCRSENHIRRPKSFRAFKNDVTKIKKTSH